LSYETKWRNTIIKSVRISETLLAMIERDCERKQVNFSKFIRAAATAALRTRNPPPLTYALIVGRFRQLFELCEIEVASLLREVVQP
jgi:hypothetical protein